MLNEQKADESLERMMEMAEDEYLKAKTKEEKEAAHDRYVSYSKIYNDRLKTQNERYVDEAKIAIETEKFDHDKARQAVIDKEESKARKGDLGIKIAKVGAGVGILALTSILKIAVTRHDIIETKNDLGEPVYGSARSFLGDWLKG